jgi:cytochrome c553
MAADLRSRHVARFIARSALLGRRIVCAAILLAPAAAQPQAAPDAGMARRMQACTPCHGKEGRATSAGYFPRIAGKPAGYLFNQLVNFRDGRRPDNSMADLVELLNDAYLRDIASYFAALELPYPPPQAAAAAPAVLARGEALVRQGDAQRGVPACTACHGERLSGVLPAMPGLLGLPRDYLLGQLGAWRQGERRAAEPDCMADIARRLQAADIVAVTAWISAQPPGADMKPAAAGTLPQPLPIACGSGLR